MTCKKCGMEIVSGKVYCPYCGTELLVTDDLEEEYLKSVLSEKEERPELQPQERPEDAQLRQKKTEPTESGRPEASAGKQRPVKKKKRTGIVVLVIVILLVCVLAAGFYYYRTLTRSADYQLSHAKTAFDSHHYEEASGYLDQVLAQEPENESALLLQAQVFAAQKNYKKAEGICNHLLKEHPLSRSVWKVLLEIYNDQGDYDRILSRSESVSDPEISELFREYLVPMPEVNNAGGSFGEPLELTLDASDHQLKVYYTLDGSTPDASDTFYDLKKRETIPIEEEGETILRAVCIDDRGRRSRILTETYHLNFSAPDAPLISPEGGTFEAPVSIAITATTGCKIYYSWDGTPTESSDEYREPLTLPEGNHILSAIAVNEYGKISDTAKANFIFYP